MSYKSPNDCYKWQPESSKLTSNVYGVCVVNGVYNACDAYPAIFVCSVNDVYRLFVIKGAMEQARHIGVTFRYAKSQSGTAGRIRTYDHPLRRRMLYPTELRPHSCFANVRNLQYPVNKRTLQSKMKARVYRSSRREFVCKVLADNKIVKATALGNLLKGSSIVVGDYVDLSPIGKTGELQIVNVYERESTATRISVRNKKSKIIASNIDILAIVTSIASPPFKRGAVDRLLTRSFMWGIKPIIIFNKMDLYDNSKVDLKFEKKRLQDLQVPCFEFSATKDNIHEHPLEKILRQKTVLFTGQSGVGKTSTIKALSGGEIDLKTRAVQSSKRGSHTTTWAEIIDCDNYSLVDCPGMSSISLNDIDANDLINYWPDLKSISTKCKFSDCNHQDTSQGCAFEQVTEEKKEAVFSRLESFKRIQKELSKSTFRGNRSGY